MTEQHTPRSVVADLVHRWWLLLLLVLLGAGGGAAYGLTQPPVYTAQAYVIVVAERTAGGEYGNPLNFAQAYGRVITQPEVIDEAAAQVGGVTTSWLRANARAATSPDAPLIEINGTARSADRAAAVANAVSQALVTYGDAHKTETGVRISSFSRAAAPASASSPQPVLSTAVGGCTGLLIGGLAVVAGVGRRRDTGSPAAAAAPYAAEPAGWFAAEQEPRHAGGHDARYSAEQNARHAAGGEPRDAGMAGTGEFEWPATSRGSWNGGGQ